MTNQPKFFMCKHCGNFVTFLKESGAPLTCCGDKMTYLTPNTVDAATEKHIPVVHVDGTKVTIEVGSVEHPMVPEHFIEWIYLATNKGFHVRKLDPSDKPHAVFVLEDETPVAAYEFCNLHGLWVKEL